MTRFFNSLIIVIGAFSACVSGGASEWDPSNSLQRSLNSFRNPNDGRVLIVAHRGDVATYPENSIPALQSCIDMGVDVVEIDVRKTKDGHLVLMHDKTINRTTSGKGRVQDIAFSDLRKLRLKTPEGALSDQRVPTLAEALELCRNRIIVQIDAKTKEAKGEAIEMVVAKGMGKQLLLNMGTGVESSKSQYGDLYKQMIRLTSITEENCMDPEVQWRLESEDVHVLVVKFKEDDARSVTFMPKAAETRRVWVQTFRGNRCGDRDDLLALQDPDQAWGWHIERGASAFLTDHPQALLSYLEKRGLR